MHLRNLLLLVAAFTSAVVLLPGCASTPAPNETRAQAGSLTYRTGSLVPRKDKDGVTTIDGEEIGKTLARPPQMTGAGPGSGR